MRQIHTLLCLVCAGGLFGLGSCPVSADPPPLQQLTELSSVDGVLNATLDARSRKIDLGDVTFDGASYNGDYAGPLLRVRPGDVMHIKLVNHLSELTNLHFHGLHTSPLDNGDDIYLQVKPGESLDYEVRIPLDQPPGLYWYHPHIHGISEMMVNGGLAGGLLVEGMTKQIPSLANVKEQVLIFKEYQADEATTPELKRLHKLVQTINGQQFSTITMHKGETQLWHIADLAADDLFHLSLNGHEFHIIGWDGVPMTREEMARRIDLGPASRIAILVNAGDQPGSFDLVSEQTPTGIGADRTEDRIIGKVIVDDGPAVPTVPWIASFPDKPDLRKSKIDTYRTIVFSEEPQKDEYYVNGKMFDHDRIDIRVPLGTTEKWTIRNDSDDTHVFHIHQMHFQVVEINGEPQPFKGYLDTVRVPERSSVKLIMPFTDPVMVGEFVYHCHVLQHEDKGMMANIEVYDPENENVMLTLWRSFIPQVQYAGQFCGARTQGLMNGIKSWF